MQRLFYTFWEIFSLKKGPDVLPYSKSYLVITLSLMVLVNATVRFILTKAILSMQVMTTSKHVKFQPLPFSEALAEMFIISLVMMIFIYGALLFYKKPERFIQTWMATLGVDMLLGLLLAVFMLTFHLPILFILLFIFHLYWQYVVHIHIFKTSFEITVLPAGLLALVYVIILHNIGEVLLRY